MEYNPAFEAQQTQLLAQQIILGEHIEFSLQPGAILCTFDVQYEGEDAYVAMDLQKWKEAEHHIFLSKETCTVPYQPGYFSFREGPILLQALEKMTQNTRFKPELLLIDGHGIAHPRKMGLASWLGIRSGIPSIGAAKDSLIPVDYSQLGPEVGALIQIWEKGDWLGTVLRTQNEIKPMFISAGHLINQSSTIHICKALRSEYRIFEPIRRADQAARKFAKGNPDPTMTIL